jgi:PIN domain nuclease of toxin-antitoxin system
MFAKRKQVEMTFTKMHWLLGGKSKLSTSSKILISKQYSNQSGKQLWCTASASNIEIVERIQSKVLRMIMDAPRYVPNTVIQSYLRTPPVKEKFALTALNTVLASAYSQTT